MEKGQKACGAVESLERDWVLFEEKPAAHTDPDHHRRRNKSTRKAEKGEAHSEGREKRRTGALEQPPSSRSEPASTSANGTKNNVEKKDKSEKRSEHGRVVNGNVLRGEQGSRKGAFDVIDTYVDSRASPNHVIYCCIHLYSRHYSSKLAIAQ